MRVDIEHGKYTYVAHDRGAELLRYGEFWQDVTGQKVWYCAAYELQEARAERDALAAHVERLTSWIKENAWHRDDCDLLDLDEEGRHKACSCGLRSVYEAPETSLARLKAKWQAEAFDELAGDLALNADNARENGYMAAADAMQDAADYALTKAELRRQARGGV